MLSYEELFTGFRKGMRNGNWKWLGFLDNALYRAAMWYVKRGGRIVNKSLLENISILVERLKETKGRRIFKRGFKSALEMLDKGEEKGIFVWAPGLRNWLSDPDYVFWLGMMSPPR
jgi:hypothetical protein